MDQSQAIVTANQWPMVSSTCNYIAVRYVNTHLQMHDFVIDVLSLVTAKPGTQQTPYLAQLGNGNHVGLILFGGPVRLRRGSGRCGGNVFYADTAARRSYVVLEHGTGLCTTTDNGLVKCTCTDAKHHGWIGKSLHVNEFSIIVNTRFSLQCTPNGSRRFSQQRP